MKDYFKDACTATEIQERFSVAKKLMIRYLKIHNLPLNWSDLTKEQLKDLLIYNKNNKNKINKILNKKYNG